MTGIRRATGMLVALVAALSLAGCFLLPPAPAPTRSPVTDGIPAELADYYAQTLEWTPCEGGGFDCTTVTAPRPTLAPAKVLANRFASNR